eukprot:m51a1_g11735 hypothetical protein (76) ;mRNA; r:135835-136062
MWIDDLIKKASSSAVSSSAQNARGPDEEVVCTPPKTAQGAVTLQEILALWKEQQEQLKRIKVLAALLELYSFYSM